MRHKFCWIQSFLLIFVRCRSHLYLLVDYTV